MSNEPTEELQRVATAVGGAWVSELLRDYRAASRAPVGAWPGTVREARMRVLARFQTRIDPRLLDDLARIAMMTARTVWGRVAEPDVEPD